MTPGFAATTASGAFSQGTVLVFMFLMVRDMAWKGVALWKSGNKKQLVRFICLFIFNTAGILPIIYLAFFQKKEIKEIVLVKTTKNKTNKTKVKRGK